MDITTSSLALTQTAHLWLYFLFVFGIVVLPGMDMAYVMAASLADGRRAGLAAVAGVIAGGFVHVALSAVGIGVVLKVFPAAFNVMLIAGAAYIAWIGWSLWRGASALGDIGEAPSRPLHQIFMRGMMSCLLNPKAYVFMLAVFPQFLRPEYGSMTLQAVILAAITAANQGMVYGAIAIGAAGTRRWLRDNPHGQVRLGKTVGLLLIAAAAWTAWESWKL